jgi:uncharacterized protein YggE
MFTVAALSACGNGADDATVVTRSTIEESTPAEAESAPTPPVETTVEVPVEETPPGATIESVEEVRSITVGGMGAEYAQPDRCTVNLAVEAQRATVGEASQAASASGEVLTRALADAGVPESAIQTSNFWIYPVMDQFEYRTVVAYDVTIEYRVTLPDVDNVGSVLASAVQAGGDSVRASSMRFEADHTQLMDAARAAAWADVRTRAASTADHVGEPLGDVLDVHEKVLVTSSQGMMEGGEGDSASFDIPVSPGVSGVTVLLTVTYEIGA